MSAAEMSETLRMRILKLYREEKLNIPAIDNSRITRASIFAKLPETERLRKQFESAESKHSSVVTENGLADLTKKLAEELKNTDLGNKAEQLFNKLDYSDFINIYLPGYALKSITQQDNINVLANVPQDTLAKAFVAYLIKQGNLQKDDPLIVYIRKNIQSGHLAGIFTYKLKLATGAEVHFEDTGTYRDFSVTMHAETEDVTVYTSIIEKMIRTLLDADFVTSQLYNNVEAFTTATKSVLGQEAPYFTTELQLRRENEASGRLLQNAGKKLNQFIKAFPKSPSATFSSSIVPELFAELANAITPVANMLLEKGNELTAQLKDKTLVKEILSDAKDLNALANTLINTKGSPSIKEALVQNYINILQTGKSLPRVVTRVAVKEKIKAKDDSAKTISKSTRNAAANLTKLKNAIKQKAKNTTIVLRNLAGQFTSLTSLQTLINANLSDRIRLNMGTGNRTDVLNYRSGRFAESVEVKRMSQSRAGAITAFYTYMKNPYATFSDGGKQQLPKSRDPKLLISKSIREIAASRVANRLRAVAV